MLAYFLPMILFLGVITSYQDIKLGKIKNKWIILVLCYAFIANLILIGYFSYTEGVNMHYVYELISNFIFSIIIGFSLWHFKIWSAADGKLFIAFSALMPLSVYSIGYQEWIPSLTLLINVFVISLIIILVLMLIKAKTPEFVKVLESFLKEFFSPRLLFSSIVNLFAINWLIQFSFSSIGINNLLIIMLLTMLAYTLFQKIFSNKMIYLGLVVSASRLYFDKSVYSVSFLISLIFLVFIWRFFRSFLTGTVSRLGAEMFSSNIKINKLKQGMVLAETIIKKEKVSEHEMKEFEKNHFKVLKHEGVYFIKKPKSPFDTNDFLKDSPEGLTEEQIQMLKNLGLKKVKVSSTLPFAPFMFLGAILTLLVNGNILIWIRMLF